MSCLYCLSARQHGRLWFCIRCGELMLLRPEPLEGILTAQRPTERRRPDPEPTRDDHPSLDREKHTACPSRLEPGHWPDVDDLHSDVQQAVVLDLDAARRVRDGRTP